jgi:hypothetical protein
VPGDKFIFAAHLKTGFAPLGRGTFLCSAKEKYPKERRSWRLVPHFQCGIPCASRQFGRSPNSQDLPRLSASKSSSDRAARLLPNWLRCSAAPTGIQLSLAVVLKISRARSLPVIPAQAAPAAFDMGKCSEMSPQTPSGAAEHHRENRIKLAPCLSVIERSEIASCASAGFTEKRRVSGHKSQIYARTSHRVPFSLGTFSWASKRKYLAQGGETQC